ncbi:MAG: radical SAM protein [Euryarchaeota archaeon]|nr:radical SAM protein [Euryarchaeota archaeon]
MSGDFVSRIRHPCFAEAMHSRVGRVHLPVAPRCNIRCRYCERRVGEFYHSLRPGIAYRVIRPKQVEGFIRAALEECPSVEVAGVAGPGEPLFNPETFEALRIAGRAFPGMRLCVCTNGLLLPGKAGTLRRLGVDFLTVTVNAATPATAARLYSWARYRGNLLRGEGAAAILVKNQFLGLERAVSAGMEVKVNTVLVPGINDGEVAAIAKRAGALGARVMNVMPLIPSGEFTGRRAPTCGQLGSARRECERVLPVFRLCKQCRADSCGIPGSDMEHIPRSISEVCER